MPCYCAAYNCREKSARGGLSFHSFPRDPFILKKWCYALRRKDFVPTKNSKLCSKHFTPDSFNTSAWSSKPVLRPDAVPSIFDFPDRPSDKPIEFPEWLEKPISSPSPVSVLEEISDWKEKTSTTPASGAQSVADSLKNTSIHPIVELIELPVMIANEGQVSVVGQKTAAPAKSCAVLPRIVTGKSQPVSGVTATPMDVVVCEYSTPSMLPNILSIPPHFLLGGSIGNALMTKEPAQSFETVANFKSDEMGGASRRNAFTEGKRSDCKDLERSFGGEAMGESQPLGAVLDVTTVEGDEMVKEYELTVTEESLMRLHGLSFTLPVPCDLCPLGTVFDDLDEFDAHMSEHLEAKMFACQLCSNTYRSWSNLVAHRKMFHLGEVLSCEHCGSNKTHKRLEGAVQFPVGGKPHGCEECLIGLDSVKEVYQHFVQHKAPPCGNRRKLCKHLGPSQRKRRSRKAKSGNRNPSVSMGKSISVPVKDDEQGCGSVDRGDEPNAQSGSMKGSQLVCPSEGTVQNLSEAKGKKVVVESAVVEGCSFIQNIIKDKSMNVSVKRSGGDLVVSPASLQSVGSNLNSPEHSGGDLSVEVGGDETENAAALKEDLNSRVNSTISQDNVSEGVNDLSHGHSNVDSGLDRTESLSALVGGELSALPAEKPRKKCPEKKEKAGGKVGGGTSHKKGSPEGIRPPKIKKAVHRHLHACPHCPYNRYNLQDYRLHLLSCSENSECIMCSSTHLKRNVATDHGYCQPKTDWFPCVPCKIVFASDTELQTHWNGHHAQTDLPCCFCGRKFGKVEYVTHIGLCRKKFIEWDSTVQPRSLTCDECGRNFTSMGQIRKHLKRHEKNRNISLYCNVCNRLFQHKGAYSKHLWANPTHGPAEHRARIPGTCTEYMCEKCGKTFGRRGALNGHLRSHDGVRPHLCSLCPKAFTRSTSLTIHMRKHTGERPFMCDICGKSFKQEPSFTQHFRRHHREGENNEPRIRKQRLNKMSGLSERKTKKYTCEYCSKILSSKQVFEGHVRLHTGERPYVCNICDKGFTLETIMKKHRKGHKDVVTQTRVEQVKLISSVRREGEEEREKVEGGGAQNCIYFCSKCGLGVMSPSELEEHLERGDCFTDEGEMYCITIG
ncbi:uncharacterized protein LOC124156615 [Ischnura elegans]|uniref:uncharacterized protein LOC124156615 n=1 Tax=Ischnura elegans TaxID=197161 RepID=UPI001ED87F67|nr:uncharacterized protein LOC124156615 [Ischnura elegans]